MAAHVPIPPTVTQFQRPGTRVFSSLEECALSHSQAISLLARCLHSCYGPAGGRKLLVTRPGCTMVVGSARAFLPELQIEHPAGILAREACHTQEQECGDGTNGVLQLASAMMAEAETLLRRGMLAPDLCIGYRLACAHACRKLEELSISPWETWHHVDAANPDELSTTVCEDTGYSLASTISDELISQLLNGSLKGLVLGFTGGTLEDTSIFKGAILQMEPLGTRMRVTDAQLALYVCPFGERRTRVAGTTLIEHAIEMEKLRAGIERVEEERVEALRCAGVTVLAVAGAVSELALHFCNRAEILVVKLERRSHARQLALASGAQALTTDRLSEHEELGQCHQVYPSEIGGLPVMAFESCTGPRKGLITVVVRGSTPELVNYAVESVKAALQLFKRLREDPRMVAGAGAVDIQLGIDLEKEGQKFPFLEKQGFLAFARALECLPHALADNWGLDVASVLRDLRARHRMGETNVGVEENGTNPTKALDSFMVKKKALELATDVAVTLIGSGTTLNLDSRSNGAQSPPPSSPCLAIKALGTMLPV
uniref:T-complex protein 1 subunit theta n=1 Tax=Leptobrachium leishanense TaxID=445787 RepID=A0A8C5M5K5_9ANUR